MSQLAGHEIFPLGDVAASYRLLTADHVGTAKFEGETILKVGSAALTLLAAEAFVDCAHLMRSGHLAQLRQILDDPEASDNDRFVALDLLKNAIISSAGVLPMCQDTGTAIIIAKKGGRVWTAGGDQAALAEGIRKTYTQANLRYSQLATLDM